LREFPAKVSGYSSYDTSGLHDSFEKTSTPIESVKFSPEFGIQSGYSQSPDFFDQSSHNSIEDRSDQIAYTGQYFDYVPTHSLQLQDDWGDEIQHFTNKHKPLLSCDYIGENQPKTELDKKLKSNTNELERATNYNHNTNCENTANEKGDNRFTISKESPSVETVIKAYKNVEIAPYEKSFKVRDPMVRSPAVHLRKSKRYRRRHSTPLYPIIEEEDTFTNQARCFDHSMFDGRQWFDRSDSHSPEEHKEYGSQLMEARYGNFWNMNQDHPYISSQEYGSPSGQPIACQKEDSRGRNRMSWDSGIFEAEEEVISEPCKEDDKSALPSITMNALLAEGFEDLLRFIGFTDQKINEILVQYYQSKESL